MWSKESTNRGLIWFGRCVVMLWLSGAIPCYGGLDRSSGDDRHTLQYSITGDIEVAPNLALFPVTVVTSANSYQKALTDAKQMIDQLEQDARSIDASHFSVVPADFSQADEYAKLSISFFGDEKQTPKTQVEFFFQIRFLPEEGYWERSRLVAQTFDLLARYTQQFKKDDEMSFSAGNMALHIENPEQYRAQIIELLYTKAKKDSDFIARQEDISPHIKEVTFGQTVQEEILNIHKGSVSLDANILFTFE